MTPVSFAALRSWFGIPQLAVGMFMQLLSSVERLRMLSVR
jgi:hypothetical protein